MARSEKTGQSLVVLQSLWSMERRQTDGIERSLEENIAMIAGAGFDGISAHWTNRADVRRMVGLMGDGLIAEGMGFPTTVDDLKPILRLPANSGCTT